MNDVKPWTTGELQRLRAIAELGLLAAAETLDRSPASVRSAASRHGISLRQPGSRRGLIVGQPRNLSLRGALRDDVVAGVIDTDLLAARLKIEQAAGLCPSCGYRTASVRRTGLCLVCHRRRLAEAHREAIEEIEARRELDRAKQAAKRRRDTIGVAP